MTKRMLIDSTHAEETRVVVLDGSRLEDFDVETAAKAQLKGNIYLAKVVRVEPSLQAAFVEYGGGRHGFLAFGEIHPDYYQIPVADRQRLLEMQEAEARAEEEAEDAAAAAAEAAGEDLHDGADIPPPPPLPMEDAPEPASQAAAFNEEFMVARDEAMETEAPPESDPEPVPEPAMDSLLEPMEAKAAELAAPTALSPSETEEVAPLAAGDDVTGETADSVLSDPAEVVAEDAMAPAPLEAADARHGDEDMEEAGDANGVGRNGSRPPARFMRSYKIQEVIRRRQILLVQVVKEERGTKGAALTTFISLAGRFCVLMPNSPRGGGISRKITSAADRRRLKEVTAEMQIPRGMGTIVRTAGAARPKAEIKRDCEYLLELWDSIRETTMASVAPALIHEEANLIKRAIRDNYSRDVEEVLVDGEAGWRAARDFMRMLMPAHARKVILWNEPQPLFARQGVEAQLDGMMQPTVQLRSGGYLVINQTEALVAIDVNSGRSTRERGIEETALKTNLEAADEVARQLRLRDLAGLIVIDFIDMESRRNNGLVEKRMKDALRDDRARIQLGSISHFGLMELSRQRLRPSLTETSFTTCPHCAGSGLVRTTETAALAVLRAVEEEGAKRRAAAIVVHVAGSVALYVLNNKRARLAEIEARYGMSVSFAADESLLPPQTRIERTRVQAMDALPPPSAVPVAAPTPEEDDLAVEEADEENATEEAERAEEMEADAPANETPEEREDRNRNRKRRRRRGGRREDGSAVAASPASDLAEAEQPDLDLTAPDEAADSTPAVAQETAATEAATTGAAATGAADDEDAKGRRRGRRGGRRRRREPAEGEAATPGEARGEEPASFDSQAVVPAYTGPTPADPFGGQVFDIFDMMDQADERLPPPVSAPPTPEPPPDVADPARPAVEADAAEATVPVEPFPPSPDSVNVEGSPELAPASIISEPPADPARLAEREDPTAAAPEPMATVMPEAGQIETPQETVTAHPPQTPALVEEEPALLNGHAPPNAEPAGATAEPVSSPVPPPVLVGSEAPGEKKRGWWRR